MVERPPLEQNAECLYGEGNNPRLHKNQPSYPPKQGTVQNIKKHRKNITQSHLGVISKQ